MSGEPKKLLSEPFVIDDSKLNAGLRGFPVGTVRTSAVSPEKGVSYVGYPVAELADLPCEDVIYLLFHKSLPTPAESKAFRADLARRAALPAGVLDTLKHLPKSGHPMEWFIAGLAVLGMTGKSPKGDVMEDALNCVAWTSAVVAAIFRIKNGWGEPIAPRGDLPFHEAFADALGVPGASPVLPELMRLFYVLHMDHGGGNLSTFSAKAVASGHADVFASMAAGMAALYGPRHGRANQECLAFVKTVGTSDPKEVGKFVRKTLADGNVVYGFGHAVLRAEDPRARIQYDFGKRHFPNDLYVQTAIALREVVPPILKENPKISNPYPNVDAVSGSLMNAVGLKDPDFYTLLFGWSRVAGIAAQIVDERLNLREGKGVPIYRCKYIAENQPPRHRG
jgi:citrate synthase